MTKLPKSIIVGRVGEQYSRSIVLDISEEIKRWPDATPTLLYKRPGEEEIYPGTITFDGEKITWLIDSVLTSEVGYDGSVQIAFTDFNASPKLIGESVIMRLIVLESLVQGEGDPPDPYESWMLQLSGLASQTLANANTASTASATAVAAKDVVVKARDEAVEARDAIVADRQDVDLKHESMVLMYTDTESMYQNMSDMRDEIDDAVSDAKNYLKVAEEYKDTAQEYAQQAVEVTSFVADRIGEVSEKADQVSSDRKAVELAVKKVEQVQDVVLPFVERAEHVDVAVVQAQEFARQAAESAGVAEQAQAAVEPFLEHAERAEDAAREAQEYADAALRSEGKALSSAIASATSASVAKKSASEAATHNYGISISGTGLFITSPTGG